MAIYTPLDKTSLVDTCGAYVQPLVTLQHAKC
jgi:hypothetical protein